MREVTSPEPGRPAAFEGVTLLHLDTGENVIERVNELLEVEHGSITVVVESSPGDALTRIENETIDCVVSGTELDEMDSLVFLEEVQSIDPELPFLFYQTSEDDEHVTEAISIGANDVIEPKKRTDRTELLAERIETLVTQYRTQRELQESHRRFQTLVSNLPGMVYRCRNEPGWPMLFVSDGCEQLTGYEPDQLVDGDVGYGEDIIVPEDRDRVWDRVQDAIDARQQYEIDYQIRREGGDRRWVWERGEPVYEDGEVWGLEGFITDISEHKRQSQQIEVLNRVIRHNLRNRMSVLLSHASHLEQQLDGLGETHTSAIRDTASAVAELSTAVREIEQIIQTKSPDRRPINVSQAIETAVGKLRAEHPEAEITVESDSGLWAEATEQLSLAIRQAVQNGIVHNDNDTPTVVVEGADSSDGTVEVRVLDDGPGIQSMELNALEDRREISSLAHGSGLGLWVMKWFVEAVNGDLQIDAREPRGTAVTFVLPKATRAGE
jgi:PAS domain S-box-containing protein